MCYRNAEPELDLHSPRRSQRLSGQAAKARIAASPLFFFVALFGFTYLPPVNFRPPFVTF